MCIIEMIFNFTIFFIVIYLQTFLHKFSRFLHFHIIPVARFHITPVVEIEKPDGIFAPTFIADNF